MDNRLRDEIDAFVVDLAEKKNGHLGQAGTLVEIEELTALIGDEVARKLAGAVLQQRADPLREADAHECPECGRSCPPQDDEPVILQGVRGEIEYLEPRSHCARCRCDFFPSGGTHRPVASGECLAEDA